MHDDKHSMYLIIVLLVLKSRQQGVVDARPVSNHLDGWESL